MPRGEERLRCRRHALYVVSDLGVRCRQQCGTHHEGDQLPGSEAGGRCRVCRPHTCHRGCGNTRRRPHRPYAAVVQHSGRIQGAGQDGGLCPKAHGRRTGRGEGRSLCHNAGVRACRHCSRHHAAHVGTDHRHRRRQPVRRAGARLSRHARL